MTDLPAGSFRCLSVDNVIRLHRDTVEKEGGLDGIRDRGLPEAAVITPQQSFGGVLLHPDAGAIAAAYLFHLAMNHPFLDGNKRAATMAALAFLARNGHPRFPAHESLTEVTLAVASGSLDKPDLTAWFREHATA